MMDVNIYVENSLVVFKELQDCKDDVIYITETRGFALLNLIMSRYESTD